MHWQITKRQTHKTADHETAEAQNDRSTKRQKAQNSISSKWKRLKTAEGTKRQMAQNGRRHKTAESTKRHRNYTFLYIQRYNEVH
jgi:hypothetical protein